MYRLKLINMVESRRSKSYVVRWGPLSGSGSGWAAILLAFEKAKRYCVHAYMLCCLFFLGMKELCKFLRYLLSTNA
jgi:hypothetical protein